MKKIFLTLYFVFDFLMSLFPIAFFAWLAAGNWSIMYFLALYLLLTSVVGIVLSKKKNLDDENLSISKNWLLPIYIVNVIGAFFLMFPFCIAFDCLSKKQFDFFAVGFSILVCEILLLRGQVKWQRAVLCNKSLPRVYEIEIGW